MVAIVHKATTEAGKKVAKALLEDGYKVIAVAVDRNVLNDIMHELGPMCAGLILETPVSKKSVQDALSSLPEDFQDIDILVNDASLALSESSATEASLTDWHTMIAENCANLVAMTNAVLPKMLAQKKGTIINITSSLNSNADDNGVVYPATVAFVRQYTVDLIADVAKTGVRAICITEVEPKEHTLNNQSKRASGTKQNNQAKMVANIAEKVRWITAVPMHVDINLMEMTHNG